MTDEQLMDELRRAAGQCLRNIAMTDDDLIDQLRRAASIWFKNSDLLLLEDFIRRFNRLRKEHNERASKDTGGS